MGREDEEAMERTSGRWSREKEGVDDEDEGGLADRADQVFRLETTQRPATHHRARGLMELGALRRRRG